MQTRILLSAFLILGATVVSDAQTPFEMKGVRFGLDRSPDDFVAGVFRNIGSVECDESQQERKHCWSRVMVVDEIASQPASKAPRLELKVFTGAEPGRQLTSRFIAFLIPLEGTDLYTGTFMSTYGETKHRRFRQLIETTITGERPL